MRRKRILPGRVQVCASLQIHNNRRNDLDNSSLLWKKKSRKKSWPRTCGPRGVCVCALTNVDRGTIVDIVNKHDSRFHRYWIDFSQWPFVRSFIHVRYLCVCLRWQYVKPQPHLRCMNVCVGTAYHSHWRRKEHTQNMFRVRACLA